MQHAGLQYGQGATNSHQTPPFAHSDIPQTGGNATSSLRQFRKKDLEKSSGSEFSTIAENIARVAPHNHYPPTRPNGYYRSFHPQYPDYNSPFKDAGQVKYSEIAETSQNLQHHVDLSPIQKHKEKEFMEMCNISQSMKQNFGAQQSYSPADATMHSQYLHKEQAHPGFKESQYQQYPQIPPKYQMPPTQCRKYPPPPTENDFLAKLQQLNPTIARSIMSDHIRDTHPAPPTYPPNLDQTRMYQNQRYYQQNNTATNYNYHHPQFGYPPSCNYSRQNQMVPPRYPTSISPRRNYQEMINYQKTTQYNPPEYAQHYQHRRLPTQEYYQQPCRPTQFIQTPESTDNRPSSGLRHYLENWAEEETGVEVRLHEESNGAEPVFVINPADIPHQNLECLSLVPTENGQYIIKTSTDNTIKIVEENAKDKIVNLHVPEVSDCMLSASRQVPVQENREENITLSPEKNEVDEVSSLLTEIATIEENGINKDMPIIEEDKKEQQDEDYNNDCFITDECKQQNTINKETEEQKEEEEDTKPNKRNQRIFSVDDIINNIGTKKDRRNSLDIDTDRVVTKEDLLKQVTEREPEKEETRNALCIEEDSIILEIAGSLVQLNINQIGSNKILSVLPLSDDLIINIGNFGEEIEENLKEDCSVQVQEDLVNSKEISSTEAPQDLANLNGQNSSESQENLTNLEEGGSIEALEDSTNVKEDTFVEVSTDSSTILQDNLEQNVKDMEEITTTISSGENRLVQPDENREEILVEEENKTTVGEELEFTETVGEIFNNEIVIGEEEEEEEEITINLEEKGPLLTKASKKQYDDRPLSDNESEDFKQLEQQQGQDVNLKRKTQSEERKSILNTEPLEEKSTLSPECENSKSNKTEDNNSNSEIRFSKNLQRDLRDNNIKRLESVDSDSNALETVIDRNSCKDSNETLKNETKGKSRETLRKDSTAKHKSKDSNYKSSKDNKERKSKSENIDSKSKSQRSESRSSRSHKTQKSTGENKSVSDRSNRPPQEKTISQERNDKLKNNSDDKERRKLKSTEERPRYTDEKSNKKVRPVEDKIKTGDKIKTKTSADETKETLKKSKTKSKSSVHKHSVKTAKAPESVKSPTELGQPLTTAKSAVDVTSDKETVETKLSRDSSTEVTKPAKDTNTNEEQKPTVASPTELYNDSRLIPSTSVESTQISDPRLRRSMSTPLNSVTISHPATRLFRKSSFDKCSTIAEASPCKSILKRRSFDWEDIKCPEIEDKLDLTDYKLQQVIDDEIRKISDDAAEMFEPKKKKVSFEIDQKKNRDEDDRKRDDNRKKLSLEEYNSRKRKSDDENLKRDEEYFSPKRKTSDTEENNNYNEDMADGENENYEEMQSDFRTVNEDDSKTKEDWDIKGLQEFDIPLLKDLRQPINNNWEDEDSPPYLEKYDRLHPPPKTVIDVNEFNIRPIEDTKFFHDPDDLQVYKDVVDSKLNSLNIQIPKMKPKEERDSDTRQLLIKFLSEGVLLKRSELLKVKKIIECKRKREETRRPANYEVEQEDIKLHFRKIPDRKKKRFRNLYADESSDDDDDEENNDAENSNRIQNNVGDYSVFQRNSTGVPKLIFKRNSGLPQPFVKLERSQAVDLLAKKKKVY